MPTKNPRKRASELLSSNKPNPVLSSVGDLLPAVQSTDNVVEDEKVKQSLRRLQPKQEANAPTSTTATIKVVICDSEALAFDSEMLRSVADDFGATSISLSEKQGLSIDRLLTITGPLAECARCVVYIAYVLNSRVNNYARLEAYTLKLANYCVDVLCEGIDMMRAEIEAAPYFLNTGLLLVTLRGDFASLFSAVCALFRKYPYRQYLGEDSVELLPSIRVHDADFMRVRSGEEQKLLGGNKETVLNYLFNREALGEGSKGKE